MKKLLLLMTVIILSMTASSQTKITRIKVIALITEDQYGRVTEESMDGRMGIDLDNQIIYSYYKDGTTIMHHFKVDRVFTCEDNYTNLEGIAKNAGSNKIAFLNIASHNTENIIIITMSDNKDSMSFIGTVY